MKTAAQKFLLLMVMFGTCMACSSDDDDGIDSNIYGIWTLSFVETRDCANSSLNQIVEEQCDAQTCTKIELAEDGTYARTITFAGQDNVVTGTYEVRGDQIRIEVDGDGEVLDFTVTATRLVFTQDLLACKQDVVYIK